MKSDRDRLWSDPQAFRQEVRLVSVQIEGLRPDELETALAYELEPMSGVSAAEAEVAWKALPEDDPAFRRFDVVVARRKRWGGGRLEDRLVRPAIVLAVLVLVAVGVDAGWLCLERQRLDQTVAERQPLEDVLDGLRRRISAAEAARLSSALARESEAKAQDDCARLRRASVEMMDVLASVCGGRAVVRTLATDESFSVNVRAMAVDAQAAAETLAILTERMARIGWTVDPGGVTTLGEGAGASFDFALRLQGEIGK